MKTIAASLLFVVAVHVVVVQIFSPRSHFHSARALAFPLKSAPTNVIALISRFWCGNGFHGEKNETFQREIYASFIRIHSKFRWWSHHPNSDQYITLSVGHDCSLEIRGDKKNLVCKQSSNLMFALLPTAATHGGSLNHRKLCGWERKTLSLSRFIFPSAHTKIAKIFQTL